MNRPILLQNICKEKEWGGNNITQMFNISSPFEKTGEVWTASAHGNGETPITFYGDKSEQIYELSQFYKDDTHKEYFGYNCQKYKEFPLLAKWIDANSNLSVQVHPDDEYALKEHNSFGKTEAWYIVSAKEGAQIVYGLKKGTTRKTFENAVKEGRIRDVLNFVPVKTGEIYYIPAGMVHALLDGVIVYEIQQSADITYRIYDWDRNDPNRKLKIDKALNVINFDQNDEFIRGKTFDISGRLITPYFNFSVNKFEKNSKLYAQSSSFKLCSVLEGNIIINDRKNNYSLRINAGNSFILPSLGCILSHNDDVKYSISGNGIVLESTVN